MFLVFDNFETLCAMSSTGAGSNILGGICGIRSVSVVITMRGIPPSPVDIRWTLTQNLGPLLPNATKETSLAINTSFIDWNTDDNLNRLDTLLREIDYVLAIRLLAQVSIDCSSQYVLRQWHNLGENSHAGHWQ
jgi:hypothetical protein